MPGRRGWPSFSSWISFSPRPRAPFAVKDRVHELAVPLALVELALGKVGLAPHRETVHEARGCFVPCVESADHAMQLELLEREPKEFVCRLGRVTAPVLVGVGGRSDFETKTARSAPHAFAPLRIS